MQDVSGKAVRLKADTIIHVPLQSCCTRVRVKGYENPAVVLTASRPTRADSLGGGHRNQFPLEIHRRRLTGKGVAPLIEDIEESRNLSLRGSIRSERNNFMLIRLR
ncbi:hypothetical protein HN011_001294 [Eciton burchellii]|jgi:hypothetical protein|nr:hypothetical protein HN011_001294 [Eciton burchellii]